MLSLAGLLCCLLSCCARICSHLLQHPAAGCCVPDKERRACHSCPCSCSCSAASSVWVCSLAVDSTSGGLCCVHRHNTCVL